MAASRFPPRLQSRLSIVGALVLGCGHSGGSSDATVEGGAGGATSASGGAMSGGSGATSASSGAGGVTSGGGGARSSGGTVSTGGAAPAMSGGTSNAGGATSNGAGGALPLDAGALRDAASGDGGDSGARRATPGWNLVAVDTTLRTYLDYVNVPASGTWTPEGDRFPVLATWEKQTTYSALRFQSFTPGDHLTGAQIEALLPVTARSKRTLSIVSAPYSAAPAPADATAAIQKALDDAATMATLAAPVDVLIPAGSFNYSRVLKVGANVRLRRDPEDSGGTLNATDPLNGAVHLAGDHSGALFLVLRSPATTRDTRPDSSGIWVQSDQSGGQLVHDVLVVGNDVGKPASAHIVGIAEEGGLWAFNDAHDGFADSFHHTDGSRFCQVVANRTQTSADRGDDLYAFVSYQGDGDVVHHCTCIANFGRDGHARGLSVVGGGFIAFDHNDIDRTEWAGIYLAQESSYQTYGVFDVSVTANTIRHANLAGSHDGLLAYSDAPGETHDAASFGAVSSQVQRLVIDGNEITDTAAGVGNGFGIELRSSVDDVKVTNNVLARNKTPGLVDNATHATASGNVITP